jgi:hypothetical protein
MLRYKIYSIYVTLCVPRSIEKVSDGVVRLRGGPGRAVYLLVPTAGQHAWNSPVIVVGVTVNRR